MAGLWAEKSNNGNVEANWGSVVIGNSFTASTWSQLKQIHFYVFSPSSLLWGLLLKKKGGAHRLARACSVGRGRGLGVAWTWLGRGLGVACAWLGRGVGVAWALRGRGLGLAWAWLGRGVGVAWAWLGRGVGVAWARLGPGLGLAWAWRGRGVGVVWAWRGRSLGVGVAWAWPCIETVIANVVS